MNIERIKPDVLDPTKDIIHIHSYQQMQDLLPKQMKQVMSCTEVSTAQFDAASKYPLE